MNTEADALDLAGMIRAGLAADLAPDVIAGIVAVADAVDGRLVDVTLPESQAVRYDLLGQLCAASREWVVASHPDHNAAFVRPPMREGWRVAFGLKVIQFYHWPGDSLADALAGDGYEVPEWVAERLRGTYRRWRKAQGATP